MKPKEYELKDREWWNQNAPHGATHYVEVSGKFSAISCFCWEIDGRYYDNPFGSGPSWTPEAEKLGRIKIWKKPGIVVSPPFIAFSIVTAILLALSLITMVIK